MSGIVSPYQEESDMGRPNILMIITHDTGRHLGCYGQGVETPNLDRLAGEGVIFTNFYCTAPQCSPSRASFLTGRYPHNNGLIGLTHRGFRLNPDEPLLPALLAQEGYVTCLFGFQHESPDPFSLGYQQVVQAGNHSCLNVTPLVLDFLSEKNERPFFAMVGFSETHRPFPQYDGPIHHINGLPYLPDDPDVRRDVASLNILVRRVDSKMGEILDAVDEKGFRDNTMVVFTTDHGIAFPGAKATLLDPGIEIALLMRGPGGFEGGKKVDAMLSNIPIPPAVQGRSMLPLVEGQLDKLHEEIFVEQTYHAAYDPMRGVRTGRYKYIRSYEERPFWFPPNVDGGDLTTDPIERENLVSDPDHDDLLEEMRSKLEMWMRETDDVMLKGHIPPHSGGRITPPDSYTP
jgi:arylsulfatase A-like enzyme